MAINATLSQLGSEFAVGAAWIDSTVQNLTVGDLAGPIGGLQFTITPNQYMFRSFVLTIVPMVVNAPAGTLTIDLINDIDLQPFSNANLPSNLNAITVWSGLPAFAVDTAVSFTFDLNPDNPPTGGFVSTTFESPLQVIGHGSFQGVIGLALTYVDGGVTNFHSYLAPSNTAWIPALVGDETPLLSGLPTTKHRLSRADWCPRCGQPIFREQLITDGYTKSLVCSDCWDRAEERYPRYVPPKEINSG